MEILMTELELLLLDWQLEGPGVPGLWVLLMLLVALITGYVAIRFLLLRERWNAVFQLFRGANIVIPPDRSGWVLALMLGVVILGAAWWALGR